MALGLDVRAIGSEGGHSYGWSKHKCCFRPHSPLPFLDTPKGKWTNAQIDSQSDGNQGTNIVLLSMATHVGFNKEDPGQIEYVDSNKEGNRKAFEPEGDPIADYDLSSNVEGMDGTQDSTTQQAFPKVSSSLPNYMLFGTRSSDDEVEDALPPCSDNAISSDLD